MAIVDPFDQPKARTIVDPFEAPKAAPKPEKPTGVSDSDWENFWAGIGQGINSANQGVEQAVANTPWLAAAIGQPMMAADPRLRDAINANVTETERIDKPLLETGAGTAGSILGNAVATAPAGAGAGTVVRGTSALAKLGRAILGGTEAGAAGGAVQRVEGVGERSLEDLVTGEKPKDFADEKLRQVGTGAGVGAAAGGLLNRAGAAIERVLPSNVSKSVLNFFNKQANETDFAKEGERIAQSTGVMLTPAQISGSKSANMAENAARQSFASRDIAFEGDRKRVQQLADNLDKVMNDISAVEASPASAGLRVQDAVKKTVSGLEDWRTKVANEDYGRLREMTAKQGGVPIAPTNTSALLKSIADENSGVGTPTGDALARFAKAQLDNTAPKTGGLTAADRQVMEQLGIPQGAKDINPLAAAMMDKASPGLSTRLAADGVDAAAPAQGNLDKLIQLRSYLSKVSGGQAKISGDQQDRRIAAQLLRTIDDDLEAAGEQLGDNIGAQLKLANARYREASQQIDAVKASPLGAILGEDITGALQSGSFNTIAPETVIQKMNALKPSELGVVRGILEKDRPQEWQILKRSLLEDAIEKAKQFPASEGADNPVLRPSVLVKNLNDKKKLEAVYSPKELAQIDDALNAARRLADKTGYNFSGTAAQSELLGMLRSIGSGSLKGVATGAGMALGARSIARVMTDSQGRAALLQLSRLPPNSERARELAAKIIAISHAADNGEPSNEGANRN